MQLIFTFFFFLITKEIYSFKLSRTCSKFIESNKANNNDVKITYTLHTKENPENGELLPMLNQEQLHKSHFNPKFSTRFLIHGWLSSGTSDINKIIRKAYLNRGNFNVIVVDWSSIAQNKVYSNARNKVETVGIKVAKFIDFLHSCGGLSTKQLYLIGHSLGAHIAGFAGKHTTAGRINTIIGLDPALPLFSSTSIEKRLANTDAVYVETIHTNGKKLGFYDPIGTASFYPNGGKKQPNCGADVTGTCSHSRSYKYFAESIQNSHKFKTLICKNMDEVDNNKCNNIERHFSLGGEPSNEGKAHGIYYVQTNS